MCRSAGKKRLVDVLDYEYGHFLALLYRHSATELPAQAGK